LLYILINSCLNLKMYGLHFKVFETLVRDAIVKHLEEKQLLRDTQHGFRKGRSCLTNLLSFLDKVSGCVDNGQKCGRHLS